jgi:hypothetical protein
MKLLIMQFSPASYIPSILDPNFLLSILFSDSLSLCYSLKVRGQVSYPYETAGKINFYTLDFRCLDSRGVDTRF